MARIKLTIPGYVGGLARSLYEPLEAQSFQTAKDLDIYRSDKVLSPVVKLAAQVTSPVIANTRIEFCHPASDGNTYWFGDQNGANGVFQAYYGNIPATPGAMTLTNCGGSVGGASSSPSTFLAKPSAQYGYRHVAELAGYQLFWMTPSLARLKISTKVVESDPYTWTAGANVWGPIFAHQGLQQAYVGIDNLVYRIPSDAVSGTADPILALTLDSKYTIKSFAPFGRFLLIGCQVKYDNGPSVIFVYDGSATTVEDIIYVGDSGLQSIRNVNGVLHILCTHVVIGYPDAYQRIYLWDGTAVVLADEIRIAPPSDATLNGTRTLTLIDDACVEVSGDKIYWGYRAHEPSSDDTFLSITNGVYAFGRSGSNQPRIDTLLQLTSTSAAAKSITCIKVIQGTLVIMYNNGTTWYLDTTLSNSTYGQKSANGVYQSNAFRLDPEGMGKGLLLSLKLRHEPLPASCGFTVKFKQFGAYPTGTTIPTAAFVTLGAQTSAGAAYTLLQGFTNLTGAAEWGQIEIDFDTVSGANAPGIIFPLEAEVETQQL